MTETTAARAAPGTVVLDEAAIRRAVTRIAHELAEGPDDADELALVGIHTRGVPLAHRLRRRLESLTGARSYLGALDVGFYRDDVAARAGGAPRSPQPLLRASRLDFRLEGRTCVLVDDVLSTGRTVRAAVEALFAHGRPARVRLAVLVDRGHRELPIRPDYVGKNLPTARGERVHVELVEVDEVDRVMLVRPEDERR